MKRFLQMLLAVLFCTTAMCITDVYADENTSGNAPTTDSIISDSVQEVKSTAVNSDSGTYSDEEVYLLAQLVYHEAHNQSYNGKVAVAEVVLNRVRSGLFPNDIKSVVLQSGQFTNSRRIKNINPSDLEVRIAYNVLNGNLRVFNDTGVLYFRNPKVTSGFSAKVDRDWGNLDYVTYIGDHAFYSQNIYNAQLAKTETKQEENSSVLDKLPTSVAISQMISEKKEIVKNILAPLTKEDETTAVATAPVVTENVASADTIVVVNETNALAEQPVNAQVAVGVQADGSLDNNVNSQAISEALPLETEENSADTTVDISAIIATNVAAMESAGVIEAGTSETTAVETSQTAAKAQEQEITVSSVDADESDDDIEDEEEEIDENDPVAVAQRQARRDQKLRLKHIAQMEADNAKVNEAAHEFAKQNENEAVERVNNILKAGQATVDNVTSQNNTVSQQTVVQAITITVQDAESSAGAVTE